MCAKQTWLANLHHIHSLMSHGLMPQSILKEQVKWGRNLATKKNLQQKARKERLDQENEFMTRLGGAGVITGNQYR